MIERTRGVPAEWHEQADLVVLGSGAAALTGAVVAAIEGAKVVVLEKTDLIGGTTSVSGGGFWIPMNHHMAERGVSDSREEALAYVRACSGGQGDDEVLEALIDNGKEMARFLEERGGMTFRPWPATGGTIDYRPWLEGAKPGARTLDPGKFTLADLGEWAPRLRMGAQSAWLMDKLEYYAQKMHAWPPKPDAPRRMREEGEEVGAYLSSGSALIGQLLRGCIEQGVTIHIESPGKDLIIEDGRVVGVRAQRDGADYFVQAREGVLVATGGYAHNEELKRMWMNKPLELSCEIEANQGDGHLMGMAVGAQVANLGDAWWMPHIPLGEVGYAGTNIAGTREDRSLPHTIIVNGRGQRFVNESLNYYDIGQSFGTKQDGPRNLPAWLLFDTQGKEKYNLLHLKVPADGAPVDWLIIADSIEELAGKLDVDPAALGATVERFNGYARDGKDPEFGRGDSQWDKEWGDEKHGPNPALGTLEKGPFYAMPLRPGALATKGGLRVNAHGEVLSAATGEPIPSLYAAGNCSTGGVAQAYPGAGATIGAGMTFGYIIGQRVAAKLPTQAA